MPVSRTYECPDCSGRFRFLHMKSDEPPPSYCALCGNFMGGGPIERPTSAHIAKAIGKVGDQTYRQLETASDARIQMAAEITGQDASEFNDMKLTNLKDNAQVGEVSAPPEFLTQSTEVHRAMETAPPETVGFQGNGAQYALGRPDAGIATATSISSMHSKIVNATVAGGRRG